MSQPQRHVTRILLVLIAVMTTAVPAVAQSVSDRPSSDALVGESLLRSTSALAVSGAAEVPVVVSQRRSLTLPALQVTFGALQIMDMVSTARGLNAGLTEANPVMRGVAGRPMALATVKAGATATTLLLVNRVARHNRGAAIVTMVALNAAYAVVVARNTRALRSH